jgi:GH15 family glucan-1,4-alpha-glucosidase
VGTVDAIQRELVREGSWIGYIPDEDAADGLPPGEGAFLACSFWLVIELAMLGRLKEAQDRSTDSCRCGTISVSSRKSTIKSTGG